MIDIRLNMLKDIEILNVRDIMALFRVDRATVYNWKKAGKIKMRKIGGRWYAYREDIEKMLQGED